MGSEYAGNPANVSGNLPGPVNIASSTSANPIVITTSAAHNLLNNSFVDVQQHAANLSANGIWQVTVLSPTTFSIPVAGVAAGGATGIVQSLSPGQAATILGDGDSGSAANFNNAPISAMDRTAFLAMNLGGYKLVSYTATIINNDSSTIWATASGVGSAWTTAGSPTTITVGDLVHNDLVLVTWTMSVTVAGATFGLLSILESTTVPGGSPTAFSKIPGSNQFLTQGAAPGATWPLTLRARFQVPGGFNGATMTLTPGFFALGAAGTFTAVADSYAEAMLYRPTGMPQ